MHFERKIGNISAERRDAIAPYFILYIYPTTASYCENIFGCIDGAEAGKKYFVDKCHPLRGVFVDHNL